VDRDRPCTCHPDDNPPRPCPKRYAYSECVKAAEARARFDANEHNYMEPSGVTRGELPGWRNRKR